MTDLEIIYRDEHYVAVYKPAGLLVHRSSLARDAEEFALQRLRDQLGQPVYLCHRLDRPTAGLLMFALDPEADQKMKGLFAERLVQKRYWAVVRGYVLEEGTIDHALRKPRDYFRRPERYAEAEPQPAVTDYRHLAHTELPYPTGPYETARYSLLALQPRTGRTHQLRRHMAHISHPIVGDARYGDGAHNRLFRERFECHRLLLASVGLSFIHPYTQASIDLLTPVDDEIQQVLAAVSLDVSADETG